ncbi:MAG: zinc ribbon domain-containing protein [Actinobacteria bacterium]|nr:zinc ribbon domain-containing protein [Actinomycetota bacterium]
MKCPDCGAENPEGTPFCGLCSRPFNYIDNGTGQARPDWYGPGDMLKDHWYSGRSIKRRLNLGTVLHIIFICLIIVAVIVAAALLVQWYLIGNKTYSSAFSGLSFKYPRTWVKLTPADPEQYKEYGLDPGQTTYNEIILGSRDKKYCCLVGSLAIGLTPDQDLRSVLNAFKLDLLSEISAPSYDGETFANSSYTDVVIDNEYPGIRISGKLYKGDAKSGNSEILVTTNGPWIYRFVLETNDPDISINDLFTDIINSINFNTEGSGGNGAAPKIID